MITSLLNKMKIAAKVSVYCSVIFFLSCNSDKKYRKSIQGDWISDGKLQLSFYDTLCAYFYPGDYNCLFKIENGFLNIKEIIRGSQITNFFSFKIMKLNDNILKIAASDTKTKEFIRLCNTKDTILFKKPGCINQIRPSSISFFSSGCFGPCPMFFMEIDSSQNFKYFGHYYARFEGGGTGKISDADYKEILDKVHLLDLNSLDSNYSAPVTDAQQCLIVIDNDNKSIKSAVYGHDKEPIEINMLIGEIFKIEEKITIKKDSTIDSSSFIHISAYKQLFKLYSFSEN